MNSNFKAIFILVKKTNKVLVKSVPSFERFHPQLVWGFFLWKCKDLLANTCQNSQINIWLMIFSLFLFLGKVLKGLLYQLTLRCRIELWVLKMWITMLVDKFWFWNKHCGPYNHGVVFRIIIFQHFIMKNGNFSHK